jgi:hypothetical protein
VIFAHLFQTASDPATDVSALESSISALERAISALESEVKALENRSVPWEYSVWIFTFLVLVGVALELWVIRHDWRDEMEAWALGHFGVVRLPGRPSLRKLRIEIASVLLITLGVTGELVAGIKISSINGNLRGKSTELRSKNADLRSKSDQLVARLYGEVQSAKQAAGEANKRAGTLEKDAAALKQQNLAAQSRIEGLRTNNSELLASISPRDLTLLDPSDPKKYDALKAKIDKLKNFAGVGINITMLSVVRYFEIESD